MFILLAQTPYHGERAPAIEYNLLNETVRSSSCPDYITSHMLANVGTKMFFIGTYTYSPYGIYIYSFDKGSLSFSHVKTITEKIEDRAIYPKGVWYDGARYIYIYVCGYSTVQANFYFKYDVDTNTYEKISQSYSLSGNARYGNLCIFDEATGILYLRGYGETTRAIQMEQPVEIESLPDYSVVISQNYYHRNVIMDSASNLHVGIWNAYLVINGELDGDYLMFYGDSKSWNVLKNPTGETATVTFNSAGGGTVPSQTVVIGQKATKPTTPSKSGYIFKEWLKDGEPFDFNSQIVDDVTLTAEWETFEEIEYIRSTGTQYIDTGFKPNNNTKVEIKMSISSILDTGGAMVFGSRESASNGMLDFCFGNDGNIYAQFGTDNSGTTYSFDFYTDYTIELSQNGCIINGTTVKTFSSMTFDTPYNMYLMALNNFGTLNRLIDGKVYYCKIWNNGTLVRDFIPVKTASGVVCMYDQVENKVYYNQGTGNFQEPPNPTLLSYIKSTGTQYIDSNIKPSNIGRIKTKITATRIESAWASICYTESSSSTYPGCGIRINTNNNFSFSYGASTEGGGRTTINSFTVQANTDYVIDYNILSNYAEINGNRYNTTSSSPNDLNMYIFANNAAGSPSQFMSTKLEYLQIYNRSNQLIADLKPALDENNVACLYDAVTDMYYYNKGTGEFELPMSNEYTELSYIESTETQYIDTDFNPNNNTRIVMHYDLGTTYSGVSSTYNRLFGAQDSDTIRLNLLLQNNYAAGTLTANYGSSSSTTEIGRKVGENRVDFNKNSISFTNGTGQTFSQNTFQLSTPLLLFASNKNNVPSGFIRMKLYSCQIYDNGKLIRDFAPAKRNSDNEIGLYDFVNSRFYDNSGTGTFLYGE